jgi:hypothetical protein
MAEPIDYLKLDIEGMEEIVLREIVERLSDVAEIRMEFHSQVANQQNDFGRVLALLARHQFRVAFVRDRKTLSLSQVQRAIKSNEQYLCIIYAHRQCARVWWQSRVVPQIVRVQNRIMRKV